MKCPDCGDDCVGCVSAEYAMFESEDGLCSRSLVTLLRWILAKIGARR